MNLTRYLSDVGGVGLLVSMWCPRRSGEVCVWVCLVSILFVPMVVRALVVSPQPRVGGNIAVRLEPVLVTARLPTCWAHVGAYLVYRLGGGARAPN